ncbi:DUF4183 domain-containing protein [Bacillus sp. mrc49]|uniref:DUF4183 domain-containing protein n=1 Tax=Peribacillus simplex TaxID=1478 RepID=A0A109N0Q3_9BACI|nr:DUF4183 domain-containing protein [Bacillus sp. mrc49]KWW21343.1 hypothetical protein AS888_17295 [Peribacillus simplex]PJN88986.1 DUF4183 domain-containing protein [Bacillus sp. mrc49]
MPLKIMKLAIEATSLISVNPLITRLFYEVPAALEGPTELTIDPASFWTDTGGAATVLPVLTAENSSFEVFINGVLQMEDISTYTPGATGVGSLVLTIPDGSSVLAGSPVVLVVTNYAPTSDVDIVT